MSGFLLGICAKVSLDESGEAMEALTATAAEYLRAGGSITPGDWAQLSGVEKSALAAAGDAIAKERAGYFARELATVLEGEAPDPLELITDELADAAARELGVTP